MTPPSACRRSGWRTAQRSRASRRSRRTAVATECVDFRAAPRAARLAFQARAAGPALYAHASGLARGDGAALGFGSGRVALYDVRRLPLPVATVRAGGKARGCARQGRHALGVPRARQRWWAARAAAAARASSRSTQRDRGRRSPARRGRRAPARLRGVGTLAPRRSFEYDGVVGGAVWHGHARVGITTATDLHICALGGAAVERAMPRCARSDGHFPSCRRVPCLSGFLSALGGCRS